MVQTKKFQLSFKDILKEEQKSSLEQIVQLAEKLKKQQTQEERKKTEEEIRKLIIKPETSEQIVGSISQLVKTEVEHIALPGYNYKREENTEQQKETEETKTPKIRKSIEKQEVIQNILLNHYELEESQIIVLTERIKQKHLNKKYLAYHAKINGIGILIVLNDEYGQAARIKKVESTQDAETQLALLIAMLENIDKKTMDEVEGFEAFDNTYTSKEDLRELYIKKINEYLKTSIAEIELSGSAEDIWKRINLPATIVYKGKEKIVYTIQDFIKLPITAIIHGKIGKTPMREIIKSMLELDGDKKITSHTSREKREINKKRVESARAKLKKLVLTGDLGEEVQTEYVKYLEELEETEKELNGTAKEIWKRINLPATIPYKGKEKIVYTIQDFIKLPITVITDGKIGKTPMREIINAMLGLKGEDKITWEDFREKGEINKKREKLKKLVLTGDLGTDTKEKYEAYLEENPEVEEEEIDLSGTAEDIWKRINLPATIVYQGKEKIVYTIQDFIKLPITVITEGKIGITPVREIINVMLGLKQDEKIKSNSKYQQEKKANKERVENAIKLLKERVLAGDLGTDTKEKYEAYLKENQEVEEEIDLSGTAKETWKQIKGEYIKTWGFTEKHIGTIQDFIKLPITVITEGKIGITPVREIINVMLGLKQDEKIKSNSKYQQEKKANKKRVESARAKLKKLVLTGDLGEEAQTEYVKYLEENPEVEEIEIELSGSAKEIWQQVKGQTITYSNKEYRVNTIQDFLELTFTKIVKGKIGSTRVREIINALLGLEEGEKIKFIYGGTKREANKLNVENARISLKNKVIAGELGEEAKKEYKDYLTEEIDLSGSLEQIWKRIQGQTITYSNSEYRVNTIQDFLELTFTKIMKGKIGNTTVREIINAILGLEEDEKIKFIYHAKKEANKLNVENARILLKDKALAGDLGQEAQKEMQTIIETENIQTQIKEVIEEI